VLHQTTNRTQRFHFYRKIIAVICWFLY
jgi:hypothetical protein